MDKARIVIAGALQRPVDREHSAPLFAKADEIIAALDAAGWVIVSKEPTNKLWLVDRTDDIGWDQFEGFICITNTEEEALAMNPGDPAYYKYNMWPPLTSRRAVCIGSAADGLQDLLRGSDEDRWPIIFSAFRRG